MQTNNNNSSPHLLPWRGTITVFAMEHVFVKTDEIIENHRKLVSKGSRLQIFDHIRSDKDTFFRAVGPVIRFIHLFSFLPVQNLLSHDVNDLGFEWYSFLTVRAMFCIGLVVFEFGLYIYEFRHLPFTLEELNTTAFFTVNLLGMLFFIYIARRWKSIMQLWTAYEDVFFYPPYKKPRYSLKLKIRLAGFILLFGTFTEHILYVIQMVYHNYMRIKICGLDDDIPEYTFKNYKQHVYANFGYNYFVALLFPFLKLSMAVVWNFLDIIIILMSIGIGQRFVQFNERIEMVKNKRVAESFWTECRQHYNQLYDIVIMINDNFGVIIVLACFNNVYFLCTQLYSNVKVDLPFLSDRIYFIGSFVYLASKFATTLFLSARVNDLSLRPIFALQTIPTESWNTEAERFFFQLQHECVALTGSHMFFLTKKFILGMTGTIATYQMIVMENLIVSTTLAKSELCD